MGERRSAGTRGTDLIEVKALHENFPVASHILPKEIRRHLLAVYSFARLTDDVGDEAEGDRLRLLDQLEAELDRCFAGTATHPVFSRLGETVAACRLEKTPFLDLIEANRQDQRIDRYDTYAELRGYCRLSAQPVGRLVLAVAGALTPERSRWSDDVCTGLQLVEHCQDVAEDARRGRIYLPREDMGEYGVSERDLLRPAATPRFSRLMAFEVDRARSLLTAAKPLVNSLHGRWRVAVVGFAAGGLAAIDAIRAADHDVLSRRLTGKKSRLLWHSVLLLAEARRSPAETTAVALPEYECETEGSS
jgi:squalene synthase HpnC